MDTEATGVELVVEEGLRESETETEGVLVRDWETAGVGLIDEEGLCEDDCEATAATTTTITESYIKQR